MTATWATASVAVLSVGLLLSGWGERTTNAEDPAVSSTSPRVLLRFEVAAKEADRHDDRTVDSAEVPPTRC